MGIDVLRAVSSLLAAWNNFITIFEYDRLRLGKHYPLDTGWSFHWRNDSLFEKRRRETEFRRRKHPLRVMEVFFYVRCYNYHDSDESVHCEDTERDWLGSLNNRLYVCYEKEMDAVSFAHQLIWAEEQRKQVSSGRFSVFLHETAHRFNESVNEFVNWIVLIDDEIELLDVRNEDYDHRIFRLLDFLHKYDPKTEPLVFAQVSSNQLVQDFDAAELGEVVGDFDPKTGQLGREFLEKGGAVVLSRAAFVPIFRQIATESCPFVETDGVSLVFCAWITGAVVVHVPYFIPGTQKLKIPDLEIQNHFHREILFSPKKKLREEKKSFVCSTEYEFMFSRRREGRENCGCTSPKKTKELTLRFPKKMKYQLLQQIVNNYEFLILQDTRPDFVYLPFSNETFVNVVNLLLFVEELGEICEDSSRLVLAHVSEDSIDLSPGILVAFGILRCLESFDLNINQVPARDVVEKCEANLIHTSRFIPDFSDVAKFPPPQQSDKDAEYDPRVHYGYAPLVAYDLEIHTPAALSVFGVGFVPDERIMYRLLATVRKRRRFWGTLNDELFDESINDPGIYSRHEFQSNMRDHEHREIALFGAYGKRTFRKVLAMYRSETGMPSVEPNPYLQIVRLMDPPRAKSNSTS